MTVGETKNSDVIFVDNLQLKCKLGIDRWEKHRLQPVVISLKLVLDLKQAGLTDQLNDSVSYSDIVKVVSKLVESKRYLSLESLAVSILDSISSDCFEKLSVNVEKPKALLHAKTVGIHMSRSKSDDTNNDYIYIKQLCVPTIIGVNSWEREEKQNVIADVTIHPQTQLNESILKCHDYRRIANAVQRFVEISTFKTVEALAEGIADTCFTLNVPRVTVSVRKPCALIDADAAGVQITRASFKHYNVIEPTNNIAYIALGSNKNDTFENINAALNSISQLPGTTLLDSSFLYETSPMYFQDQSNFLNAVCKVIRNAYFHLRFPPILILMNC
jgi:FolB domain-containing protein